MSTSKRAVVVPIRAPRQRCHICGFRFPPKRRHHIICARCWTWREIARYTRAAIAAARGKAL